MHHTNHFYGHAHILAAYCGLDKESLFHLFPAELREIVGWSQAKEDME